MRRAMDAARAANMHPAFISAKVERALQRRDWPELMTWLRVATTSGDATNEAAGLLLLSKIYSGYEAFVGAAPVDKEAAVDCGARSCTALLRACGGVPPVAECVDLLTAPVRYCKEGVVLGYVQPDTDAWSAVVSAMRATVAACEKSSYKVHAQAAILALSTLAAVARKKDDFSRAARHYRRLIALGERAGPFDDGEPASEMENARVNLAVYEAQTPEEMQLAQQQVRQLTSGGGRFQLTFNLTTGPMAVERPACSACGNKPLTTKVCGGTCGGAARYCDATCFAAHIRQHMRESGCKKRK